MKNKKKEEPGLYLTNDHAKAIEKIESTGTAAMRTGTQMLLAIEEILIDDYHFTEQDIKKIETKFKYMLKTLHDLKLKGLSVLTPNDMKTAGDIAERWELEDKAQKSGILLPENRNKKILKN